VWKGRYQGLARCLIRSELDLLSHSIRGPPHLSQISVPVNCIINNMEARGMLVMNTRKHVNSADEMEAPAQEIKEWLRNLQVS
jgi:hypothetical protein